MQMKERRRKVREEKGLLVYKLHEEKTFYVLRNTGELEETVLITNSRVQWRSRTRTPYLLHA